MFCHMTTDGIDIGLSTMWSKHFSWHLISEINVKPSLISFKVFANYVEVNTGSFTAEQLEELARFFAAHWNTIEPEPFFGWRRKRRAGHKVYRRPNRMREVG